MTDIIRRETDEIIEETLLENGYDVEEETAEEGTTIDENENLHPILKLFGVNSWFSFFSTIVIILAFVAIIKRIIWKPIKAILKLVFAPIISLFRRY